MRRRYRRFVAAAALAALPVLSIRATPGQSTAAPYVLKDFYEKREVMIPMRDGARLFTVLYIPRDPSKKYPFLVIRDAYGVRPYGPDNYRPWAGVRRHLPRQAGRHP